MSSKLRLGIAGPVGSGKTALVEALCKKLKIPLDKVAYMGDDIPDIIAMKEVGLAACPYDAVKEVRNIAHYISPKGGGKGCVRFIGTSYEIERGLGYIKCSQMVIKHI